MIFDVCKKPIDCVKIKTFNNNNNNNNNNNSFFISIIIQYLVK